MNKEEFLSAASSRAEVDIKLAERLYESFVVTATKALRCGEDICLPGVGQIALKDTFDKNDGKRPIKKPVVRFSKAYIDLFN